MKILFWFNGSGGQRRERKVVEYDHITPETLSEHFIHSHIQDDLEDWKDSLHSNSEYRRWGWDENFDEKSLEPLSNETT